MSFYNTLLEQYTLLESLETTIKANPHIPESIIRGYHSNALPNNNKNDRLLSHVLKMHKAGAITPETAHLLKPHLTALSATNQLHQLKSLNTLDDHINATKDILDKAVTKKERTDVNTPTVFENDHIIVKQHLTHESAIKGAMLHPENPQFNKTGSKGKASWCVGADSEEGREHFDNYTGEGEYPFYTIHNKKTKRTTALVANPYNTDENDEARELVDEDEALDQNDRLEIRDEHDQFVHPISLLDNNPTLKNSVVGKFLFKNYPNSTRFAGATRAELEKGLSHTDPYTRQLAISHPNVTDYDITKALDDHNALVRKIAMRHPKVTEDHVTKALDDHEALVRAQAIRRPEATEDHITTALNDENETVRGNAASHKKATIDHITKALDDPEDSVRKMAIYNHNGNVTPNHIDTVLDDPDVWNRLAAIGHAETASEDNIDKALNDPEDIIRAHVFKNNCKNINAGHINKALHDTSTEVKEAAQEFINAQKNGKYF